MYVNRIKKTFGQPITKCYSFENNVHFDQLVDNALQWVDDAGIGVMMVY